MTDKALKAAVDRVEIYTESETEFIVPVNEIKVLLSFAKKYLASGGYRKVPTIDQIYDVIKMSVTSQLYLMKYPAEDVDKILPKVVEQRTSPIL